MKLYKTLLPVMEELNGPNESWKLGEWMPAIEGELVPHKNGYHLENITQLLLSVGQAVFEAEYRGEIIRSHSYTLVREARIIRKIDTWNERAAWLFYWDIGGKIVEHSDQSLWWKILERLKMRNDIKRINKLPDEEALSLPIDRVFMELRKLVIMLYHDKQKEWAASKLLEYFEPN